MAKKKAVGSPEPGTPEYELALLKDPPPMLSLGGAGRFYTYVELEACLKDAPPSYTGPRTFQG